MRKDFASLMVLSLLYMYTVPLIASASEIEQYRVEMGAWKSMAESLGYPSSFPNIILFAPDGSCVLQAGLELGWSAEQIEQPERLTADPDCAAFTDDRSRSDPSVWVIQFNTLDAPFCTACQHVERELKALHERAPERWHLSISRVYFPD